jgi:alpha-tubulin suppressor-like RCC1 family protein
VESCNFADDDCDTLTDEHVRTTYYRDSDHDGYGTLALSMDDCAAPVGFVPLSTDCDDTRGDINPGQTEICNGVDDNCDLITDRDMVTGLMCECTPGVSVSCGPLDAMGAPNTAGICMQGVRQCSSLGRWGPCVGSVDPRTEICNGIDDDCDGVLNGPNEDGDGDGHANNACAGAGASDCDDASATTFVGAPELCDAIDNDCSSGGGATLAEDADRDGHVAVGAACTGGTLPADDCADGDSARFPGALETCDGVDSDCDGRTDPSSTPANDWCRARPHVLATSSCYGASPSCSLSCAANYGNCNAAVLDGCETDVSTTSSYCGSCTNQCGVGGTCTSSTCAPNSVVELVAGAYHACARRSSGRIACWGNGPLGNGGNNSPIAPLPAEALVPVTGITDAVGLAAGNGNTCAIRSGGTVWCWGQGSYGSLGIGTGAGSTTPVQVPGLTGITQISSRVWTTCARRNDGTIWCWGYNTYGQCGNGRCMSSTSGQLAENSPVQVTGLTGMVEVAVGQYSACARSATAVYCWGNRDFGALGDGFRAHTSCNGFDVATTPVAVTGFTAVSLSSLVSGAGFACVLVQTSTALRPYCWGTNANGQVGNGSTATAFSASVVNPTWDPVMGGPMLFAAGESHACVVVAQGSSRRRYCWGDNGDGQWGTGSTSPISASTPQLASATDGARFLTAGQNFTCFADYTVRVGPISGLLGCVGANYVAQLGGGFASTRELVPVAIRHVEEGTRLDAF